MLHIYATDYSIYAEREGTLKGRGCKRVVVEEEEGEHEGFMVCCAILHFSHMNTATYSSPIRILSSPLFL